MACLEHVLVLIPQVSLEPGQELLPGVPGGLGPVSLVALPLEGVAGAGVGMELVDLAILGQFFV